jgi:mannose-6-phosphate isomerase-like protein (cupin superfamily)
MIRVRSVMWRLEVTQTTDNASRVTVFRYEKAELTDDRPRVVKVLARTDRAICVSQVLNQSAEESLHSHTHLDGFWFVLGGKARFYTTGDEFIAELGKHDGILIPRGFPYFFEAVTEEGPLEIFLVEAGDRQFGNKPSLTFDDVDDAMHRVEYEGSRTSRSPEDRRAEMIRVLADGGPDD